MPSVDYQPVFDFWFGSLHEGFPKEERLKLWFMGKAEDDLNILSQFGEQVQQAVNDGLVEWESSPEGRLALILLLDQFTRSIHRKTVAAFSGDQRAQVLARDAINKGWDKQLAFAQRQFLYMPLMHSEQLSDQELCVSVFEQLVEEVPEKRRENIKGSIRYAIDHRDLIARFGRFPHRNKVLGRESSAEELEYLSSGASSYGQ